MEVVYALLSSEKGLQRDFYVIGDRLLGGVRGWVVSLPTKRQSRSRSERCCEEKEANSGGWPYVVLRRHDQNEEGVSNREGEQFATGAVLALLTLVQLPSGFQNSVYGSPHGDTIRQIQNLAIAGAGVASLMVAWIANMTQKNHGNKH